MLETADIINKMTIEEKAGQLIIGQAEGFEMSTDFEGYIRKYKFGGFRVNEENCRNLEQLGRLMKSITGIYDEMGLPVPILGSDQEGGTLNVFGNEMTQFPSTMAVGATGKPELAYLEADIIGFELAQSGINMAFAPVADINLQENNPVIGVRSFGDNPLRAAEFCKSFCRGLNDGGVLNSIKHFPGHGNTSNDSHYGVAVNYASYEKLLDTELVTFGECIKSKTTDTVMVSHVACPNVTGNYEAATVSEKIINGILRETLEYDGVVISDDMEMGAIANNYKIGDAAVKFIKAGGDILLINQTRRAQIEAFEAIIAEVHSGGISQERLDKSIERILKLKEKIAEISRKKRLISPEKENVVRAISENACTLLQDRKGIIPITEKNKKILLINPVKMNLTMADTSGGKKNKLGRYLKELFSDVNEIEINLDKEPDMEYMENAIQKADIVIQVTINIQRFPNQLAIINKSAKIRDTMVIISRDPYDAKFISGDTAAAVTYSSDDMTMKVLAGLINGKGKFSGILPVKI